MYLAFPIPARRLVSCLLSFSFSLSCTISLYPPLYPPLHPPSHSLSLYRSHSLNLSLFLSAAGGPSPLTEHTGASPREPRGGGWSAQVGGCRGGGERTSLEDGDAGVVGVDHGPPCPRRLEGRPRRHGCQGGTGGRGASAARERGERGIVDNNNYYTRSFANAVLRRGVSGAGWEVGERSGCRERLAAISPGYRGSGRRRKKTRRRTRWKRRVRSETGRERFLNGIVMRVFPVLSSFSDALSTIASFSSFSRLLHLFLPLSPLSLLYTRPLISPHGRTPSAVQWTRAYTVCEFVLEGSLHFHARLHVCVFAPMYICTYHTSHIEARERTQPLPS